MNAEQKFKLIKTIIVATVTAITAVTIVWIAVTHNPSSIKATIDFAAPKVEIDCNFYYQDGLKENKTPCK